MQKLIESDFVQLLCLCIIIAILFSGCSEINPFEYDNGAEFCDTDFRGGVAYIEYGIVYCNNGEYFDGT